MRPAGRLSAGASIARAGEPTAVIADFLIAAYAETHAERLLTRDRGFYRSCFPSLRLIEPGPAAGSAG